MNGRYPVFEQMIENVGGVIEYRSEKGGNVTIGGVSKGFFFKGEPENDVQRWKAESIIQYLTGNQVQPIDHPTVVEIATTAKKAFSEEFLAKHGAYYPEGMLEKWVGDMEIFRDFQACKTGAILVGPTGCGKTLAVEAYAEAMGKPVVSISCEAQTEKWDLLGSKEMVEENGVTVTKWVDGMVPAAVRNGWILIFDELNVARPEITTLLHAVTDLRRKLIIKENGGEVISAHPDFRVFATMNEGYQGTVYLNEAFKNRFDMVIEFDYLSPSEEEKLLNQKVAKGVRSSLVKLAQVMRKAKREMRIDYDVSTRALEHVCNLVASGVRLERAIYNGMVAKANKDERATVLELTVAQFPEMKGYVSK